MVVDILVDCQHLRGELVFGRVKQRYKQLFDPLRHGDAEGVQVVRHRFQLIQRREAGSGAGNGDSSAFQAVLQNGHDVFVLFLAAQQPRLHRLRDGAHPQGAQDVSPHQLVKDVVLELRDQRDGGFLIHRPKQLRPVSRGAEDVSIAGRQVLLCLLLLLRPIFFGLPAFRLLAVILHDQGRLGIDPIVADLPPVLPGQGFEGKRLTLDFDGNSAKDSVRKAAYLFRVPAEPQGHQRGLALVVPYHSVRIPGQPDIVVRVVVCDLHEFFRVHA